MRTWKIMINPKKDAALGEYLARNTTDAKCMYNVANFYIRNTMTGIRKSSEERIACETEKVTRCWKSYFQAAKDYAVHPEKYKTRLFIPDTK